MLCARVHVRFASGSARTRRHRRETTTTHTTPHTHSAARWYNARQAKVKTSILNKLDTIVTALTPDGGRGRRGQPRQRVARVGGDVGTMTGHESLTDDTRHAMAHGAFARVPSASSTRRPTRRVIHRTVKDGTQKPGVARRELCRAGTTGAGGRRGPQRGPLARSRQRDGPEDQRSTHGTFENR